MVYCLVSGAGEQQFNTHFTTLAEHYHIHVCFYSPVAKYYVYQLVSLHVWVSEWLPVVWLWSKVLFLTCLICSFSLSGWLSCHTCRCTSNVFLMCVPVPIEYFIWFVFFPSSHPDVGGFFEAGTLVKYNFMPETVPGSSKDTKALTQQLMPNDLNLTKEEVTLSFTTSSAPAILMYVSSKTPDYLALVLRHNGKIDMHIQIVDFTSTSKLHLWLWVLQVHSRFGITLAVWGSHLQ